MFEKHIRSNPTGDIYEKQSLDGKYYQIYEILTSRYIDEDNYHDYLNWQGTLGEVNKDPVELTDDEKWDVIRKLRNSYIADVEYRISRYEQQLVLIAEEVISETTDNENKYYEILNYIQDLRNLPQTYSDPDEVIFPAMPT